MKNVAHVTSAHAVDDARITFREAATLADAGHDVRVIGLPPSAVGSFAPPPGVRISTLRPASTRAKRFLLRPVEILRHLGYRRYDVVHFHDPDLLPWMLLYRFLGSRVVYDAHESYRVNVAAKDWIPRPLRSCARLVIIALESLAARRFDGVVAASEKIAEPFRCANATVVVVRNYAPYREGALAIRAIEERDHRVCYFGMLSAVRAVPEMIEAFGSVRSTNPETSFVIGGRMVDDAIRDGIPAQIERHGVNYLGFRPQPDMLAELANCRLALCLYKPTKAYLEAESSTKLMECLATGTPVIVGRALPRLAGFVEDVGCGYVVDQDDAQAIAATIRLALADPIRLQEMSERGLSTYRAGFTWEEQGANLLSLYDGIKSFREHPISSALG
jgi:glycosyltransferase involved in cell wall biosynthesis